METEDSRELRDFKEVTDVLFAKVRPMELGNSMNLRSAAINAARQRTANAKGIKPPKGWREGAIITAAARIGELWELIEHCRLGIIAEHKDRLATSLSDLLSPEQVRELEEVATAAERIGAARP